MHGKFDFRFFSLLDECLDTIFFIHPESKESWMGSVTFFHSEMLLSHFCYQTTHVPELSILKTHHKSQIPTLPALKICSLLSR